jgi:hypothetical protein
MAPTKHEQWAHRPRYPRYSHRTLMPTGHLDDKRGSPREHQAVPPAGSFCCRWYSLPSNRPNDFSPTTAKKLVGHVTGNWTVDPPELMSVASNLGLCHAARCGSGSLDMELDDRIDNDVPVSIYVQPPKSKMFEWFHKHLRAARSERIRQCLLCQHVHLVRRVNHR